MSILHAAAQAWRDRGDVPLFTFLDQGGRTERTFDQQATQAQAFAAAYRARGIGPGDLILILMDHGPQMVDAFLGALWIGAVPSFMPPPSEKQDAAHFWSSHAELFRSLDARLLVTDLVQHSAMIESFGLPVRYVNAPVAVASAPVPPHCAHPGDLAFLQHSSGTTGLKKGVMLTHAAVLEQIDAYSQAIGMTAGKTVVSWLPLYHDMGLIACFILPLVKGAHTVMMNPFEWVRQPLQLLDEIERSGADFVWMPNFAFNLLAQVRPEDRTWKLSGIKAFINCSEPCRADTFDRFLDAFSSSGVTSGHLQVCYAMAETVFAVTQTMVGIAPKRLDVVAADFVEGRIGLPLDGQSSLTLLSAGVPVSAMKTQIFDGNGSVLPERAVGEIGVAAPFLFKGYFGAMRADHKTDEWHLTGDLGFHHQGELYVTGRKKDVLIVRGKKYLSSDIEHAVIDIPGVKAGRCAAFASENGETGTEDAILALELLKSEVPADKAVISRAVKRAVFDKLGLMLADVHIVGPGWIVKTTSGKVSRYLNQKKYQLEKGAIGSDANSNHRDIRSSQEMESASEF